MEDKLRKLYNTLMLIETRGESTKIMGECLRFTEQLINEARERNAKVEAAKEVPDSV